MLEQQISQGLTPPPLRQASTPNGPWAYGRHNSLCHPPAAARDAALKATTRSKEEGFLDVLGFVNSRLRGRGRGMLLWDLLVTDIYGRY